MKICNVALRVNTRSRNATAHVGTVSRGVVALRRAGITDSLIASHLSVIGEELIEYHGILVDCSKRVATNNGQPIELTNAEFNILEMLIKSPGKAFSKEELTEYALGRKFTAYDRSIDVHVSNLRNKLGKDEGEGLLKTVRGFGYVLATE